MFATHAKIYNSRSSRAAKIVKCRQHENVQCLVGLMDSSHCAWEFPQLLWDDTGIVGSSASKHAVAQCLRLRLLSTSQKIVYAVLLLFAMLHSKDVQICTKLHRELPAVL